MRVPEKWSDVTLAQFYNLQEAVEMDYEDGVDRITAYLSALTYKPITYWTDEISTIQLRDAIGKLKFINDVNTKVPVKASLKIGKKRFVVDMVLRDSIASSFIDLATLCKDKDKLKLHYHEVLAIFFYEVNIFGIRKKRTVTTQRDVAEYLKEHCTMDIAFMYAGFFLTSYRKLLRGTKVFLEKQIQKTRENLKQEVNRPL